VLHVLDTGEPEYISASDKELEEVEVDEKVPPSTGNEVLKVDVSQFNTDQILRPPTSKSLSSAASEQTESLGMNGSKILSVGHKFLMPLSSSNPPLPTLLPPPQVAAAASPVPIPPRDASSLAPTTTLRKSGAHSVHAARVFDEMSFYHQPQSASVPTSVFTFQCVALPTAVVLHARTAVQGAVLSAVGRQGLAIIHDTSALQAKELLSCGGDFTNSCDFNLIGVPVVFVRSCDENVVDSWLLSSSDWIEQQPCPPPPMQFEFKCDSAALRPSPWPSFLLSNGCSMSWVICWTPSWPFHPRQNISCVPGTALQESLTCLMALSVSMDGCALIQELVQRKCGDRRCSLLEESGQKIRVTRRKAIGHWQAKQDLLQQSLSFGASYTEVLNLKWSIQSQLIESAGVPPLLIVATTRWMAKSLLLPEHRVVAVTQMGIKAFLDCILTTAPMMDKQFVASCLCRVGLSMNDIELQPWPPPRQDCNNLPGDIIKFCCSLWSIFCLGLVFPAVHATKVTACAARDQM